jgi:hypothetical protein
MTTKTDMEAAAGGTIDSVTRWTDLKVDFVIFLECVKIKELPDMETTTWPGRTSLSHRLLAEQAQHIRASGRRWQDFRRPGHRRLA